ncbi:MAG: UDP-N-acetylmuramoyl-L-alanine--D-glutamate ligase [Pseudomonadota bacterium]
MNYAGKHVLVLGLGESGLAMARWLDRCGATVRVADTRNTPQRLALLQELVPAAQFIGGDFQSALLDQVDIVAVSPGLSPNRELAQILPLAAERSLPVWGEIEFFAQALSGLRATQAYAPKVIAVTGTNGKTTVTSLVGLLCERAGLSTKVAGNISPAALDVLRQSIDDNTLPQAWVLELSSFQLHTTFSLQADAATVLNVTQDHLDWHGDMAAYVADKARVFGTTTVQVLNRDDAVVMQMRSPTRRMLSFGVDAPTQVDCFGLLNERDMQWLSVAVAAEDSEKKRKKGDNAPMPVSINRLMPSDALRIRGQHNAVNALAALALCRAIDLPFAALLHGLREYAGEPHRVQHVACIGGVDYYDDSKGTNVGATVAALKGLGVGQAGSNSRLILIAGGDGKGQDFTPLAEPVARYVRTVFLIGKDAARLHDSLEQSGVELIACATLQEAVQQAAAAAHSGDAVVLSPACASLDMFASYMVRAQVFIDAVREVAFSRGEVAA